MTKTATRPSSIKAKQTLAAAVTAFAVLGSGVAMALPAQADPGDTVNPLVPETYRYSSEYGPRCIPVINGSTNHLGQDMGASDGSTIRAIADGVVTYTKNPSGGGSGYLAVKHVIDGEVVYSGYYHMWQATKYVKVGQKVKKGQRIALVGNSGPSTAPHLHFEIWKKAFYGTGYTVNPVNYMKSQGTDIKKDAYLVYNLTKPTSCTYYATTKSSLRSSASGSSSVVKTVYQNQKMTSIPGFSSQSGSYVKVTVDGVTGWAYRPIISPSKVRQTQAGAGPSLPATDTPKTTNTTANVKYKTTSNLNMRSGASTSNSVVRVLTKGAEVSTTGKQAGSWLQVKSGSSTGWVSSSYLSKVAVATPKPSPKPVVSVKAYTSTANVNFRSGASTKYQSLGVLKKGTKVTGTGKTSAGWIEVKSGSKTGWVSGSYLTTGKVTVTAPKPAPKPAPAVKTTTVSTTANVHFRSGAGTSHKSLGVLKQGTKVTVTGKKSGNWSQVKSGTRTGWVSASYLKTSTSTAKAPTVSKTKTKTVKQNLNVRTAASMSSKVVVVAKKNSKVSVLKTSGAWSQIKFGSKTGWVVSSYLK